MKRLRRQLPFLRSVVKEANRFKRQELYNMLMRIKSMPPVNWY